MEEAEQVRITGGIAPDKQIQLALFLASDDSQRITRQCFQVDAGLG